MSFWYDTRLFKPKQFKLQQWRENLLQLVRTVRKFWILFLRVIPLYISEMYCISIHSSKNTIQFLFSEILNSLSVFLFVFSHFLSLSRNFHFSDFCARFKDLCNHLCESHLFLQWLAFIISYYISVFAKDRFPINPCEGRNSWKL